MNEHKSRVEIYWSNCLSAELWRSDVGRSSEHQVVVLPSQSWRTSSTALCMEIISSEIARNSINFDCQTVGCRHGYDNGEKGSRNFSSAIKTFSFRNSIFMQALRARFIAFHQSALGAESSESRKRAGWKEGKKVNSHGAIKFHLIAFHLAQFSAFRLDS